MAEGTSCSAQCKRERNLHLGNVCPTKVNECYDKGIKNDYWEEV